MNRLQKKCVIATASLHLLLLVILFVGPAFFNSKPKVDDSQDITVIPANLIEAAFNSGVKNATPPAPAPIVQPQQPQPHQVAPAPKPIEPMSAPTLVERMEKFFKSEPAKPTPQKTEAHKIQVNTQLVTRPTPQNVANPRDARAINAAIKNLQHNLKSGTTIDMPGNSSVAYANYASAVKSVYEQTLSSFLPTQIANDNENAKVKVTIANDGTVISSQIISPSGDSVWDAAVQKTLDRVTFVAPFPEGTTEKERIYYINFNPQVERTLE